MQPDDQRSNSTPIVPQRDQAAPVVPPRDHNNSHEAAANIARSQIESIYENHDPIGQTETEPATNAHAQQEETANPYRRTHSTSSQSTAEEWKKYHSSWQQYYQQYYERYYIGEVYKAKNDLAAKTTTSTSSGPIIDDTLGQQESSGVFSRNQAINELRNQLRGRATETAKKVRASRHFVPIAAAAVVMLLFMFLQYNRVIFAAVEAYKSPGSIEPANIIVNPTQNLEVGPEPMLIIPKINVEVPVDYNATPQHESQMKAMENGVAYFGIPGANALPGQIGNTVISGHSSNDVFDSGSYKFIFAQLERLNDGDTIYLNYEGTRYTYTVTKKEVVQPTDVDALRYETDKPVLTLITCTPTGTDLRRLLVTATQISPDPAKATQADSSTVDESASGIIPGQGSPSFIERLFGN